MPTLHVRSVPEELYERIQKLAYAKNRSLSAQVVMLLNQALQEESQRKRQTQILNKIRRRRFVPPAEAPDSTRLLREDRRR